jgi:hypothetical protein
MLELCPLFIKLPATLQVLYTYRKFETYMETINPFTQFLIWFESE